MGGNIERMLSRRYVAAAAFLLLSLLIGLAGAVFVQRTTTGLLEAEARLEAERWSAYLSHNIADLQSVAKGQSPSMETLRFITQAREVGQVYSFRVYDSAGRLMLRSDDFDLPLNRNRSIEKPGGELAAALGTRQPRTFVHKGVTHVWRVLRPVSVTKVDG